MMVISVRKWLERAKFIALFLLFTILLHHLLQFAQNWLEPTYRFREPHGPAVKATARLTTPVAESMRDRLWLFYWFGE